MRKLIRRHGLFRADNPPAILDTICGLATEPLSARDFWLAHQRVVGKITLNSARDRFYFLVEAGFVTESASPYRYVLTPVGKKICDLRRSRDPGYQDLLGELLLKGEKGDEFRDFLRYCSPFKAKDTIIQKFKRQASTLLAWCRESALAKEDENVVIVHEGKDIIRTPEEFFSRLKSVFHRLSLVGSPGATSMFVGITDVYRSLGGSLDWSEENSFDRLLGQVVEDPRYKPYIELAGAPPAFVDRYAPRRFEHAGRNYYFISVSASPVKR